MTIGKLLGGGLAFLFVAILLIGLAIAVGGLVGAGITVVYNTILGTSFALEKGAWFGSIVGILGGASASANANA